MAAEHSEAALFDDLPCMARSRVDDESLIGTASVVRRWILVEQPGPWGRHAPRDSRMPAAVAADLERRAEAAGARVLLIRRPGGRQADETPRRVFVAVSTAGGGWAESLRLPSIEALSDVDVGPLAHRASIGGDPVRAPLLLVCTNGAHDGCCAREGQPLVRALTTAYPDAVWEASHVGGCRFSGNLVCLPEGIYYGRLDADSGVAAVEAHRAGRIYLPGFRGRSGLAMPVQAAEAIVRDQLGLDALDAVRARTHRDLGDGVHEVGLALAGGRAVTTRLMVRRDAAARPLTCAAEQLVSPPRYELIALTPG